MEDTPGAVDAGSSPVTSTGGPVAYGAHGLLVPVEDAVAALDLARRVRAAALPVVDVVVGERSLLLDGLPSGEADDLARPGALTRRLGPDRGPVMEAEEPPEPAPGTEVVVDVVWDGADLDDVARAWGTDADGVADRMAGLELTVAFCGFAPGFAYLAGLPASWQVPRLDEPRTRVPAGAVALAGPWCGVYPAASPGGWRVVGRTDAVLWDAARPRPALLTPGTRVRFRRA